MKLDRVSVSKQYALRISVEAYLHWQVDGTII